MKKPKNINKKFILGLTGGFGTGKSTVALILKSFGAKIIDADKLAAKYLSKNTLSYKKIVMAFGPGILDKNGKINRKELANAAFKSKAAIHKLNSIVHPAVIRDIHKKIKAVKKGVVVLDVPLLFESGLEKAVDKVAVVKLDKARQFARIRKKSLLSGSEINKRIKAQLPLSFKVRGADFVIDNNGTIGKTKKQTQAVWRSLSCQLGAKNLKQIFSSCRINSRS